MIGVGRHHAQLVIRKRRQLIHYRNSERRVARPHHVVHQHMCRSLSAMPLRRHLSSTWNSNRLSRQSIDKSPTLVVVFQQNDLKKILF